MGVAVSLAAIFVAFVAHGADDYRLLKLEGNLVKWGSPMLGAPATVTYAYVSEPTSFPGARNCQAMVPMDELLAASGISLALFRRETEAALAAWEAVAGVTFRLSADPARADIMIGAQATPRRRAFADVAYAGLDGSGVRSIDRSLICLNPAKPWAVGFTADGDAYDLRYVLMHEAGHAIGLDHSGSHEQVMSYRYPAYFRGLQPGDIEGAAILYGEPDAETPVPLQVSARATDVAIHTGE